MEIGLDRIIALSASLGACFSAIAAFVSVRQSIKQRNLSYLPEIVFRPVNLYISDMSPSAFPMGSIHNANSHDKNDIALRLENIGLGTAVSLKYEWFISLDNIIKEINMLLRELNQTGELRLENGNLIVTVDDKINGEFNINLFEKTGNFDYILPIKMERSSCAIVPPITYLHLFMYWTLLKSKLSQKNNIKDINPPVIEISYFDIGGVSLKRDFYLDLSMCYEKNSTGYHYYGRMTVSRKSRHVLRSCFLNFILTKFIKHGLSRVAIFFRRIRR